MIIKKVFLVQLLIHMKIQVYIIGENNKKDKKDYIFFGINYIVYKFIILKDY